jgi:hypothetical protein
LNPNNKYPFLAEAYGGNIAKLYTDRYVERLERIMEKIGELLPYINRAQELEYMNKHIENIPLIDIEEEAKAS